MLRDRCRESRRVGGHDVAPHSHRGPCAATDLVVAAHRTGELDSCLSQVEYAVRSVWRPAGPDVCDAESTVSPSVTVGATPRTEVGSRLPTGALPTLWYRKHLTSGDPSPVDHEQQQAQAECRSGRS